MKKTVLLILFLLCVGMLLVIVALNKQTLPANQPTPTTTPVPTASPFYPHKLTSAISVISTRPTTGATNIPLTQGITITLNTVVKSEDLAIAFAPAFPYTQTLARDTIVITPSQPLLPNLTYFGFVTAKGVPIYSFSFSTITDPSVIVPDFANDVQTEINRHQYPDSFLASFLPYKTDNFSIIDNYVDQPDDHFAFFVTIFGDRTQSIQEFWNWAISTGLTEEQLSTLDIRFVN